MSLPEVIQGAQEWVQENLDTNAFQGLPDFDQAGAEKLFRDLQLRFQGEYIVDLAALRQTAEALLPLLETHPESRPYAAWLKPRLDYLQVAEQLRQLLPTPKTEPGAPPATIPNPAPQQVRKLWISKVADLPPPAAAKELVPRLKTIFTAIKIPPELVWLAEVESSFDSRARSPAGAVGLFQLMPATAKRFDLSLWPRDQRLQLEASAGAAARYLKLLYARFGDWQLALAAYNAGEGTVNKLMNRYQTKTYDGIARHLPAETQLFVPRVEAILLRREGVVLTKLK